MIDICDFAVGLSRQLYGLTIASERPGHRMSETWHPLGPVAIITAFNFPVAVWAWNAALALVCGDSVVWKPSEKTPLTALAVQAAVRPGGGAISVRMRPPALAQLVLGDATTGAALVDSPPSRWFPRPAARAMGRIVGQAAASRFARSLLELGGNNATIVAPSADMDLALSGCAFGFMGTDRAALHLAAAAVRRARRSYDAFVPRIISAAARLPIGDPRDPARAGRAADRRGVRLPRCRRRWPMRARWAQRCTAASGSRAGQGVYVRPAVVEMPHQTGPMLRETFAPILYCLPYDTLDEAIALNNAAAQGLSSSIFTTDLREAEAFVAAAGSDCGIANVNIGTSGAEIGGAFGGEKETGGGREVRIGQLEGLYAPPDEHGELFAHAAAGAGGEVRAVIRKGAQLCT